MVLPRPQPQLVLTQTDQAGIIVVGAMKDFEALHGEGSWTKVMDEYKDIVNEAVDEIWEIIPDMSGKRE